MEGAFGFDSKLYRVMEKIISLVKLNLIWMLFCIPIITIGAANCALHEVAARIASNREGYVCRTFLAVFKRNFRRATVLWIPMLLAGVGIILDYLFWNQVQGTLASVMKGLTLVLGILYLFITVYVYALMDRMDTDVKITFRNAFLLAFKYLPQTFYQLLWLFILWIAGQIWAIGLLYTFLAGFATVAVLHARVLEKIFIREQIAAEEI